MGDLAAGQEGGGGGGSGSVADAAKGVSGTATSSASSSPVVVSLKSLGGRALPLETLSDAFGPSSLGIILIKDLPPAFTTLRLKLLQYASYLAHLPADELTNLTVPKAKYLTGWSHGVETLKSGRADSLKGSWYANCSFYHDRHSAVREGAWGSGNIEKKIAELACESGHLEDEQRQKYGNLKRRPTSREGMIHGSEKFDDYPEYTSPNVWPAEELLPGFRQTLEDMCCLIIDVAVLVAKQCDRFAAETGIKGYEKGYLERVVSTSRTTKARLLHYFPPGKAEGTPANSTSPNGDKADKASADADEDDDWCTTHKDHGCLTGLTSALFIDESEPEPVLKDKSLGRTESGEFELPPLQRLSQSPDPDAGLYIRSRTGSLVKVAIPADCLAFQTGEALERVTKGNFAAVPHFVRGPRPGAASGVEQVARNTLAVFTQPNLGEAIDEDGTTFAQFAREIVGRNTVG